MIMAKFTYAVEPFSTWMEEARGLFREHWAEIANYKEEIPLHPDWSLYAESEAAGKLLGMTIREKGTLVGYALWFIVRMPHYYDVIMAQNDIFYVRSESRGNQVMWFVPWCEDELRRRGVRKVMWHIKFQHDWSKLLERQGYLKEDMILGKLI